jgi:hypothetical protein
MTRNQVKARAARAWKLHDSVVDNNNRLLKELEAGRLAAEACYDKAIKAQSMVNDFEDLYKRFHKRGAKR